MAAADQGHFSLVQHLHQKYNMQLNKKDVVCVCVSACVCAHARVVCVCVHVCMLVWVFAIWCCSTYILYIDLCTI